MHKEYKRFLLNEQVASLLDDIKTKPIQSTLFFTKIKLCKEVHYEHSAKKYIKVVQSGSPLAQSILFKNITPDKYKKQKKHQKGDQIRFQTALLHIDQCKVFIESYKEQLRGLYILQVPRDALLKKPRITEHSLLEKYIESEISDDPRYEKKYLALFGNPSKHPYNIYTIFKDLENKRLKHPEDIIFEEMKSADAIRIVLYYELLTLQQSAQEIRKKPKECSFIQKFCKDVQRSVSIMECYQEIFDENLYQKISIHFNTLQKLTKTYDDLSTIHRKFQKLNNTLKSTYVQKLISNLQIKIANEQHKIANYFESREFSIIINQYELFLKEKNRSYNNYEAQLPFGYSVNIKIRNRYNKLLQLINFLDGCNDEKSYEKRKIAFTEFLEFMKIFQKQLQMKSAATISKKADKILTLLIKHEKRNKNLLIIKMLLSHIDMQNYPREIKYLKKKERKLQEKQKKFDKTLAKDLQKFKVIP